MSTCDTSKVSSELVLFEIIEGLREYQMFLIDSAGKAASNELALKLYGLAEQHAEFERQLRDLSSEAADREGEIATPFLNQIRTLGERLRKFDDLASSRYVLCEIIQTEERMIRRFRMLIDQVTNPKWRRRLSAQLDRLLDIRANIRQYRDSRLARESSTDPSQRGIKPPHINHRN